MSALMSKGIVFGIVLVILVCGTTYFGHRFLFGEEFIQIGQHKEIEISGDSFVITRRAPHGVIEVTLPPLNTDGEASSQLDRKITMYKALGFSHGMDRMMQMILLRWIGQGRLSEHVPYSNETIRADIFMRNLEFRKFASKASADIDKDDRRLIDSYVDGVNYAFQNTERSFVLSVLGVKHIEPWTATDCIQISLMSGWIGMASVQGDIEKWIVQALKHNKSNSKKFFKEMFQDIPSFNEELESIDRYLGKIKFGESFLPSYIYEITEKLSIFKASNNWCVGGKKSETGSPMCAADPHLTISMYPGFWYETIFTTKDRSFYHHGFSIPGIAGSVMGRSKDVVFSLTYGWMDQVDYFIEECDGYKCRVSSDDESDKSFADLIVKKQTIWTTNRKTKIPFYIYKTPVHKEAILDVSFERSKVKKPFKKGYYLSRRVPVLGKCNRWNKAVKYFLNAPFAKDVFELKELSHSVMIPMNLLFADKKNIMYQQTGAVPKRLSMSGILPVPSWNKKTHMWGDECVDPKELVSILNPEEDYLVTANDKRDNPLLEQPIVNIHMGNYRSSRAKQLLESKEKVSVQFMKKMQSDVYSLQAEKYMKILKQVITPAMARENVYIKELSQWNCTYNKDSVGALVFELFKKRMYRDVFGKTFGKDQWESIRIRHIPSILAHYFDDIVLSFSDRLDGVAWDKSKDKTIHDLFLRVLEATKKDEDRRRGFGLYKKNDSLRTIEEREKLYIKNMIFAKILPVEWGTKLGLNYGPVVMEGSTTTLSVRHNIFDDIGDDVVAGPAFRMVTDMSDQSYGMWTVMIAGPSDRWGSKYYNPATAEFFANKHQYHSVDGVLEE